MDRRAYADIKKGRVYFVAQHTAGSWPWGTHYYHPKTGVLCYLVNSDLSWRPNEADAQADLDAYALQHDLAAAVHPGDESAPSADPLDVAAEVLNGAAEAEAAGAPEAAEDPATPAGCSRVEPDPEKMAALQNRLRSLAGELFAVKDRKRAVDADFAAQIKGVEASMQTCLNHMHDLEWPSKPEPARLPFETASPAPPETKPAAPPETKSEPEAADDSHLLPEPEAGAEDAPASSENEPQEPALINCPACSGGISEDGEECRRCMGTGRIIPPAAPLAPCGHPVAAILDEHGSPRPCVLCAQDVRPKRSSRRSSRHAEAAP